MRLNYATLKFITGTSRELASRTADTVRRLRDDQFMKSGVRMYDRVRRMSIVHDHTFSKRLGAAAVDAAAERDVLTLGTNNGLKLYRLT